MTTKKNNPICLTEEEYFDHLDNNDGVCLACTDWTDGRVEPDAEEYECEECGASAVCGAEQALILGVIEFVESPEEYAEGVEYDNE